MIFQHVKRQTCLIKTIVGLNLLLAFTAINAAAGDGNAVWLAGDSLQALFKDPDTGMAPSAETLRVGQNFHDFCSRWIGDKNGYALQNVRIKTTDSCSVKEYSQCGNAYELRISKAPGSKVYVGTLKYVEKVFRTPVDTSGIRKPENFALAEEVPVTEFFMFRDGKWRY
jgi:hypothetical protein